MAQWTERQPANQKVRHQLIPSQGPCLGCGLGLSWMCARGNRLMLLLLIDVSLSSSLPLSLKRNKTFL